MRSIVVGLVASALIVGSAHGDVLCKTKNGSLKLRVACNGRETQIDPVIEGLGSGLVIRDATGALVGIVNGPTFSPPFLAPPPLNGGLTPVVRRIGTAIVQFNVNSLGLESDVGSPVPEYAYPSLDCSGAPWVLVDPHALMTAAWIDGDRFHYALLPGSPRTFHSTSFFPAGGGCPSGLVTLPTGGCCKSVPDDSHVKNLADVADLDLNTLGVVPPFHAVIQ